MDDSLSVAVIGNNGLDRSLSSEHQSPSFPPPSHPASPQRREKSDWDGKGVHSKSRNTRVIAYGADGSVIRFDSLAEAAEFFGLKRVDTLRRYIDNSWPMPDGSTFCDYLL